MSFRTRNPGPVLRYLAYFKGIGSYHFQIEQGKDACAYQKYCGRYTIQNLRSVRPGGQQCEADGGP